MPPPPPGSCRLICLMFGESKTKECMRVVMDVPCPLPRRNPLEHLQYLTYISKMTHIEFKHSAAWKCFNCGEPAYVIIHSPMGWTHKEPPFIYDIAHAVCRNGGPCRKKIDDENREWAIEMGYTPPQDASPPSDAPPREPLASSCAKCHSTGPVRTCGKCRLIRYCGRECQAADWLRHKVICKAINKVEFNPQGGSGNPDPFFD